MLLIRESGDNNMKEWKSQSLCLKFIVFSEAKGYPAP